MQVYWIYNNDVQQMYSVGIYHGDKSGHVIIYCGKEIIKIDFHVLLSKTYSFYLGDELFELKIHFENDRRLYSLVNLNQNAEIAASQNSSRFRYLNEKQEIILFILAISIMVFLIMWVVFS